MPNDQIKSMEIYVYNSNTVSIKDINDPLNIGDKKWDFVFSSVLENTSEVYFMGRRLDYFDSELEADIELLNNHEIVFNEDYEFIFFKLKAISIVVNRGLVASFWDRYAYPALIFSKHNLSKDEFEKVSKAKAYENIFNSIESFYIVYRSIENNVLWIEKTYDMPPIKMQ